MGKEESPRYNPEPPTRIPRTTMAMSKSNDRELSHKGTGGGSTFSESRGGSKGAPPPAPKKK